MPTAPVTGSRCRRPSSLRCRSVSHRMRLQSLRRFSSTHVIHENKGVSGGRYYGRRRNPGIWSKSGVTAQQEEQQPTPPSALLLLHCRHCHSSLVLINVCICIVFNVFIYRITKDEGKLRILVSVTQLTTSSILQYQKWQFVEA